MTQVSEQGPSIAPGQMVACLAIGSIGLLILGVQPVLLGPLVAEGRIGDSGVGHLVTIELLAIALGSLLGTRLLRQVSARLLVVAGSLVLLAANAGMTIHGDQTLLLALRGIAGMAEGLLLTLPIVAIARSDIPERLAALFLVGQTLLQLTVAAVIPNLSFGASRADAGFLVLSVAAAVALPLAIAVPDRLSPTPPDPGSGALTRRSVVALLAAASYLGGIVVVWSYFGLWLSRHGHTPGVEGVAVALSLAAQVCGATIAARFSDRLRNRLTVTVAAGLEALLVAALLAFGQSGAAVYAFSVAFGFFWLFALPSFTGWLIEIDPRRRAVLYLSAAQLGGSALLPTLAGPVVDRFGVNGALYFGMTAFGVGVMLSTFLSYANHAPLIAAEPGAKEQAAA